MAVTSASTTAAVQAQYDDNADYESDSSGAKAALFLQACRILKRRVPESMTSGAGSVTQADYQADIDAATAFVKATAAAASGCGFTRGRCP